MDDVEISYGDKGEDEWWATVGNWRTYETYQTKHADQYNARIEIVDRDPTAQAPQSLPPLEHDVGPLLDASEA